MGAQTGAGWMKKNTKLFMFFPHLSRWAGPDKQAGSLQIKDIRHLVNFFTMSSFTDGTV